MPNPWVFWVPSCNPRVLVFEIVILFTVIPVEVARPANKQFFNKLFTSLLRNAFRINCNFLLFANKTTCDAFFLLLFGVVVLPTFLFISSKPVPRSLPKTYLNLFPISLVFCLIFPAISLGVSGKNSDSRCTCSSRITNNGS